MKKTWILLVVIAAFLVLPGIGIADAECDRVAESNESPETLIQIRPGRWHYNYNIAALEVDRDGDGQAETIYQYCYVVIEGRVSKQAILRAIAENKKSADVGSVGQDRTEATEKLQEISEMSYTELDQYVDNTFGNLSTSQKTALKRLYKSVLALIKMGGWDE